MFVIIDKIQIYCFTSVSTFSSTPVAITVTCTSSPISSSITVPNIIFASSLTFLFKILEVCFNGQNFTIRDILSQCNDEQLLQLITEAISSGVYQSSAVSVIVKDTVNYIKKNKLYTRKEKLLQRIQKYTVVTEDDQKQLNALLNEKLELDKEIRALGQK